MEDKNNTTLLDNTKHISSPDELASYLKVTSVGIWIVLVAAFLMLAGIVVWSLVGEIEMTKSAIAVVSNNKARIVTFDNEKINDGTTIWIENREYQYLKDGDDDDDSIVQLDTLLPDGNYEASIDLGKMHPIEYLFSNR